MTNSDAELERARLDRWLWAARFFKSRSLASHAIEAGHVRVNAQRCKASRDLHVGELVQITTPSLRVEVAVRALSLRRGPAPTAQTLYEETASSRADRERREAERAGAGREGPGARPTKRDRRKLDGLLGGQ